MGPSWQNCSALERAEFTRFCTPFSPEKFYTEQIFVLVSMQLRHRVDPKLVKHFKRWKGQRGKTLNLDVASAREWDLTAQMNRWYCAVAHLRGSIGLEWDVAPIYACLRRGPRRCFLSECCTGGESMAALGVNGFLCTHPLKPSTRLDQYRFSMFFA